MSYTKVVFLLLITSWGAQSQSEISFSSEIIRLSMNDDKFLRSIDFEPKFDQIFIKGITFGYCKVFEFKNFKLGINGSLNHNTFLIDNFYRRKIYENGSNSSQLNKSIQKSTHSHLNFGVNFSKNYSIKSINLRTKITTDFDLINITNENYFISEQGVKWKDSEKMTINNGTGHLRSFTTLNLTFQQSIQLNKSEKNPLWFNLNMRYIPWTEYTYNQHTLWFGAGLSLGFNGEG